MRSLHTAAAPAGRAAVKHVISDVLRDELVRNYSDGTLERFAVHLGLLKHYLRFLAGDPSHSRSVSECSLALLFTFFRITFSF